MSRLNRCVINYDRVVVVVDDDDDDDDNDNNNNNKMLSYRRETALQGAL